MIAAMLFAAMLFALTVGVADAQQLSPDQRAILESGGRVVLTEEIAGSVWPRITVLQFVVGSPEESAAVFMDYARHASFVPNVLVSRVSRVVDAATLEVDYVLSVPIAPDEPYRGGTLFTYRNLVVPGGQIAGLGFILTEGGVRMSRPPRRRSRRRWPRNAPVTGHSSSASFGRCGPSSAPDGPCRTVRQLVAQVPPPEAPHPHSLVPVARRRTAPQS